jgi:hypothetical protein
VKNVDSKADQRKSGLDKGFEDVGVVEKLRMGVEKGAFLE